MAWKMFENNIYNVTGPMDTISEQHEVCSGIFFTLILKFPTSSNSLFIPHSLSVVFVIFKKL